MRILSRILQRLIFGLAWPLLIGFASAAGAEPPAELARWFAPQTWERDVAGPILSLGQAGDFDDMHLFAPAVADSDGKFLLWYPGSRGSRTERVFKLGLAISDDGKQFQKSEHNPVFALEDGARSVLTPAILRNPDGSTLREQGKLRMWFSAADLRKGGLHTLHETSSSDGQSWAAPSPPLLENAYCPTVFKDDSGYQLWFSDVRKRPWLIRHATSADGTHWKVDERPALQLSQAWEAEVLVYPTVLKVDGVYLMWYGSYNHAVRRQTTAIGFAASTDGITWHKHPQNPVFLPDPERIWESNYVGSGCVMRLADGSYRYWYASRTKPPFEHLYFAINTARWPGPLAESAQALVLPVKQGEVGTLITEAGADRAGRQGVEVLEVIDEQNVIVRAWNQPSAAPLGERAIGDDTTFADLWLQGLDTRGMQAGDRIAPAAPFEVIGSKSFGTTCGSRSLPLLQATTAADTNRPAK